MTIAKKIILVLDTETCDLSGSVYDVGYTIATKSGAILTQKNWLVEEIFTDAKKMMGAFYAKKLFTHYAPMLQRGEIAITPWAEIVENIRLDVANFGVNVLAAYNLGFDRRVMAGTNKLLGDSPIFSAPVDMLDIWQFACETKSPLILAGYLRLAISKRARNTLIGFALATLVLSKITPPYPMQLSRRKFWRLATLAKNLSPMV